MKRLAAAFLLCSLVPAVAPADPSDFPRPAALEPAIHFWTRVYTQVSTHGGLIHDRDDLDVVYETIHFTDGMSRRRRIHYVRARKQHYRDLLREIASSSDREDISPEAREVLKKWPAGVSDARLRTAVHNIRFQLGQADKFRAGLVRSGAWEPHIRNTLEQMGLPVELSALPYVESSFNPDAYSRVGAAGIWQFTRATGRRYMRIDHVVDERMDPFKSTLAAARLLEHNYAVTGSWALAITAYNHGLAGIRRAVHEVGSRNIATIIDQYDGRIWGFASRNFYAAFLAAVDVDFHAEKYFGTVDRHGPVVTTTVRLPFYANVDALTDAFDVSRSTLHRLNRGLREPVWDGRKRVPRGFELRLPAGPHRPPTDDLLAQVDRDARYFAQVPDRYHRVRPGEALSTIARRYGVSTHELVVLNNLRSRNYIRAGQTLRLPVSSDAPAQNISDGTYTVQRGDTLSGIAHRVGLTVASLASVNGLASAHYIYPGQELRVAGHETGGASVVADAGNTTTSDVTTVTDAAAPVPGAADDTDRAPPSADAAASDDGEGQAADSSVDDGADTVVADADPGAVATDTETADASQPVADTSAQAVNAATPPGPPPRRAAADHSGAAEALALAAEAVQEDNAAEARGEETDAGASDDATDTDEPSAFAPTTGSLPQRLALTGGLPGGPPASDVDDSDVVEATDPAAPDDGATSHERSLSADPSDYAVADDGTIEVQAAETLGHYAEWLDLRASRLRRVNGMRYGTPVVIGKRLRLDFSRVDPATFEDRRLSYHEELQARFFEQFRIVGSRRQLVQSGDSLWTLARRSDNVPVWLLRQYNPDLDFSDLKPGMPVTLPVVERQPQSADGGSTRAEADPRTGADDAGA